MWADIPGANGGQCAQGALVGTPSASNYVTMSLGTSPSPSGPYYMTANVAYAGGPPPFPHQPMQVAATCALTRCPCLVISTKAYSILVIMRIRVLAVRMQYSNQQGSQASMPGFNLGMSTVQPTSTSSAPTMKSIQTSTTTMTFKYYPSGANCWPKIPTGVSSSAIVGGLSTCTTSSDPSNPLYPSGELRVHPSAQLCTLCFLLWPGPNAALLEPLLPAPACDTHVQLASALHRGSLELG